MHCLKNQKIFLLLIHCWKSKHYIPFISFCKQGNFSLKRMKITALSQREFSNIIFFLLSAFHNQSHLSPISVELHRAKLFLKNTFGTKASWIVLLKTLVLYGLQGQAGYTPAAIPRLCALTLWQSLCLSSLLYNPQRGTESTSVSHRGRQLWKYQLQSNIS